MPKLAGLYKEHQDHHDQFELIAIHDSSVKSFADLDERMEAILGEAWPAPEFPLAIDKDNETRTAFSVSGNPSYLVISPEGRIVGDSLRELEKNLPPRKPSVVIANYFDVKDSAHHNWNTTTVGKALQFFSSELRQKVQLDPETATKSNISNDSPVPLFIANARLSLRSQEQLMFRPMGLKIEANDSSRQLVLRAASEGEEALSPLQLETHQQLEERLQGLVSSKLCDLVLSEIALAEAIERVALHFNLSMGIHSSVLNRTTQQVSGVVENSALKTSLNELLKSLDLCVAVQRELVMVQPSNSVA